jgi:hypothetical protein
VNKNLTLVTQSPEKGSVSYQGSLNCLHSELSILVCEEGGGLRPMIPAILAVGVQRAWRQPREGLPLYILVPLLQGLATNKASRLFCESIIPRHSPLYNASVHMQVLISFRKINHCGVQLSALIL